MADRPAGLARWVRSLLHLPEGSPARFGGRDDELMTGERAVLATESRLADTIGYVEGTGSFTVGADPRVTSGAVETNAFGRPVGFSAAESPSGLMGAISGLAMTGQRATGFVPGNRLAGLFEQLNSAVERRLPLVLHATFGPVGPSGIGARWGHDAVRPGGGSGAFVLFARDARDAVDLTLLARCVAELSLTPGIVAMDGPETAWSLQNVELPEGQLIREFLGDPTGEIESPTPSQVWLFGERRRRLPRWFDPDYPTAHGLSPTGADLDAAVLGRRTFFAAHVRPIAAEAMKVLGALTGRELSFVRRHRLDNARHVLVARGSAVDTAEAVADHLRRAHRARIGVLGISWSKPFPRESVREALANAETVTVLDRAENDFVGDPPLTIEIRAALQGSGPRVLSATFSRLTPARVAAVWRNMQRGEAAADNVRLGAAQPTVQSNYPKRQVLLQRVHHDYPELDHVTLPEHDPIDVRPRGSRSILLQLRGETPPDERIETLVRVLADVAGGQVRGRAEMLEPGVWTVRVTGASKPLRDTSEGVEVDAALIEGINPPIGRNPLKEVQRGGRVGIASTLEDAELWATLPRPWRETVRERDLHLFRVGEGCGPLIALGESWLAGSTEEAAELEWRAFARDDEQDPDEELPLAVRRFARLEPVYDSVPRFFGEYAQPRIGGDLALTATDPYLALGAVPAGTATFHDRTSTRERLPRIDAEACTGCGKCWTSCPDTSIAPVAIATASLLDAAAGQAGAREHGAPDAAAGKLQRAHKQLAARADSLLAKATARRLTPELLREAFDWLLEKMNPADDDERQDLERAFAATLAEIEPLRLSATDPFFHEPHAEKKGAGELLMLAVNPQSCQGCGLCAAVCPSDAVLVGRQRAAAVEDLRRLWSAWEKLPDTPGSSIKRAAQHAQIGGLPAILMSRHCLFTMTGGDRAERGSGERLATRQVAAVIDYRLQQQVLALAGRLDELQQNLAGKAREALTDAATVDDLDRLERALAASPERATPLSDILGRLEQQGQSSEIDAGRVHELLALARQIGHEHWRLVEGPLGIGSARYGVVVAGSSAARWAASFPRNAFCVPMTVDQTASGPDLAVGLAQGLLSDHLRIQRLARRAELLLDNPPDAAARGRAIDKLGWEDLSAEERSACPPLLVVAGTEHLRRADLSSLDRLLGCNLPVKLLVLDDRNLLSATIDPTLLGLVHRRAFVLATSISSSDHLFEGVGAALEFTGPALIHVHAPSPGFHGFPTDRTVERAELAVAARVHPLVRYDPSAEGVFGSRIDLQRNPDLRQVWLRDDRNQALTPAAWADGEERYRRALHSTAFPGERGSASPTVPGPNGSDLAAGGIIEAMVEERRQNWRMLQELAGVVTPFTAAVHERVEQELGKSHREELDGLAREHEANIERLHSEQNSEQAARLREQLMRLARLGAARRGGGGAGEGPQ